MIWLFALLIGPPIVLSIISMVYVEYIFGKWAGVDNQTYLTGVDVAERLKEVAQLTPVVEGSSTADHYDPRGHKVRLRDQVAYQPSVLALAIAAHEMGHAQQHQENSGLIQLRNFLVPAIQISPSMSYALVSIGLAFRWFRLVWIGAAIFASVVVFMFLTLPVEVDASRRGMNLLSQAGLLESESDQRGAKQVLTAAALTYVAASALSVGQLVRYIRLALLR
jgi:hypothetical protein